MNKKEKKEITHILFDLDGVIIESESIYAQIAEEIAKEYGKKYTLEIKQKVMGTPEPETARIICTELQLPLTSEQFLKKYEEKVRKYLQNPDLLPGVDDLIKHLHESGIPMAVATSSREDLMYMKTTKYKDLMKLFHHIVCGSSDPEIKKGKPAPDIFLVCASRFPEKPCPCNCLVFEDSPNGVQAAINAGMQVVMIPNPDLPQDHPIREKATMVISEFSQFSPEILGLPKRKNVN